LLVILRDHERTVACLRDAANGLDTIELVSRVYLADSDWRSRDIQPEEEHVTVHRALTGLLSPQLCWGD